MVAEGNPVDQPVSVVYFREDSGAMAKALGTRIRDQGAMTRLIWAHLFTGEDTIIENARAVVIEADCAQAAKIALAYERFAHDVEIHYVTAEGQFIDEPDHIRDQRRGHSAFSGEGFVDPKAALANLAAAEPEPEPVAVDVPVEDDSGESSEVVSEAEPAEVSDLPSDGTEGSGEAGEPDSGVRVEEVEEDDNSS